MNCWRFRYPPAHLPDSLRCQEAKRDWLISSVWQKEDLADLQTLNVSDGGCLTGDWLPPHLSRLCAITRLDIGMISTRTSLWHLLPVSGWCAISPLPWKAFSIRLKWHFCLLLRPASTVSTASWAICKPSMSLSDKFAVKAKISRQTTSVFPCNQYSLASLQLARITAQATDTILQAQLLHLSKIRRYITVTGLQLISTIVLFRRQEEFTQQWGRSVSPLWPWDPTLAQSSRIRALSQQLSEASDKVA